MKMNQDQYKAENLVYNYHSKIVLDLPGGGTMGAGYAGSIVAILEKGLIPKTLVTVSVTSVESIAIALACHRPQWRKNLLEMSVNIKQSDFTKISPVTKKGNISWRAIWRMIKSKFVKGILSLGIQDTGKLLDKHIGEDWFKVYQNDHRTPEIYIATYNYLERRVEYTNIKNKSITWEKAKIEIEKSSVLPVWMQLIIEKDKQGNNVYYTDPGVADQNALNAKTEFIDDHDLIISVFPRASKEFKIKEPQNPFDVFNGFMQIRNIEGSMNDEYKTKNECKKGGKQFWPVYMPFDKIDPYETDKAYLEAMQKRAYLKANEQLDRYLDK